MMYCNTCDSHPCICKNSPRNGPISPVRETYQPIPYGITKDQFGAYLYGCIETIGGILGVDQQRANAIHRSEGFKMQSLLARRKALQVTLAQQLPTLSNDEMDQVLEKYPWVVGC
jgi:hypothetical protein